MNLPVLKSETSNASVPDSLGLFENMKVVTHCSQTQRPLSWHHGWPPVHSSSMHSLFFDCRVAAALSRVFVYRVHLERQSP